MTEALVFAVAAMIVVGGALGVILSPNPVHSALSLVATLFGIAVLFVAQEAHFLAAVQVIVYAGAIVVLFLFVIMLLGVDRTEDLESEPLTGQRPAAILAGLVLGGALLAVVVTSTITGVPESGAAADGGTDNIASLGRLLFTDYLFAFEVTSLLLVIAVVGAVLLARSRRGIDIDADEPVADLGRASEGDDADDDLDDRVEGRA